jgi:hypothetical protein
MATNARFWEYVNGDYVKVTLAPGQGLEWHASERTEEGWRSEYKRWVHDGERVLCDVVTAERDCDGRLDRSWEGCCFLTELLYQEAYGDESVMVPRWRELSRGQRDYEAEKAGY